MSLPLLQVGSNCCCKGKRENQKLSLIPHPYLVVGTADTVVT